MSCGRSPQGPGAVQALMDCASQENKGAALFIFKGTTKHTAQHEHTWFLLRDIFISVTNTHGSLFRATLAISLI